MEAGGIEPPFRNDGTDLGHKSCELCQGCCAAPALHSGSSKRQFLASIDPELQLVLSGWHKLPEAVQSAIAMLIRANVPELPEAKEDSHGSRIAEDLAMRIARDCRYIIQGCLREEEWQDADQEFYEVIVSYL
jgi:hypothetical protein